MSREAKAGCLDHLETCCRDGTEPILSRSQWWNDAFAEVSTSKYQSSICPSPQLDPFGNKSDGRHVGMEGDVIASVVSSKATFQSENRPLESKYCLI